MPSVTFTPSPWFVKLGDRVSWRDCRAFTYPKFQVILAVFQDVHQHKCLAVTWLLSLRKIPPVIITWQNADETRLEKSYRDWPRPRRSTVWSQQQTCSLAINRLAEGLWVWTALWIFVSTMPKMTNTIIACVYIPPNACMEYLKHSWSQMLILVFVLFEETGYFLFPSCGGGLSSTLTEQSPCSPVLKLIHGWGERAHACSSYG